MDNPTCVCVCSAVYLGGGPEAVLEGSGHRPGDEQTDGPEGGGGGGEGHSCPGRAGQTGPNPGGIYCVHNYKSPNTSKIRKKYIFSNGCHL